MGVQTGGISCLKREQVMTEKQLTIHKGLLLEKRDELRSALLLDGGIGGHASGRFADSLDQSVHALETALQARLRQNHSRLLRAVEAAMGRLDRGTFGLCESCEQPIPAARLNAVPWTRLCRDCKEQQDAEFPTPLLRG
jgi:DnaK suppressor protein